MLFLRSSFLLGAALFTSTVLAQGLDSSSPNIPAIPVQENDDFDRTSDSEKTKQGLKGSSDADLPEDAGLLGDGLQELQFDSDGERQKRQVAPGPQYSLDNSGEPPYAGGFGDDDDAPLDPPVIKPSKMQVLRRREQLSSGTGVGSRSGNDEASTFDEEDGSGQDFDSSRSAKVGSPDDAARASESNEIAWDGINGIVDAIDGGLTKRHTEHKTKCDNKHEDCEPKKCDKWDQHCEKDECDGKHDC